MAVMMMMMSWALPSYRLAYRRQCFGETYIVAQSPGMRVKTIYFFEKLASVWQSIQCQNPEEQCRH
jgi:hypothetical protein